MFNISLLVIGIIIISELVNYLLIERKKLTFSIISGFFLSSMIYLIINTFKSSYSFKDIILSIPILAFSYKVGTYSKE